MFEKNTAQVNKLISKMFAFCSIAVLALAVLSWTGVFEFGQSYTLIVLNCGTYYNRKSESADKKASRQGLEKLYADSAFGIYRRSRNKQPYRHIHHLCACADIQLPVF